MSAMYSSAFDHISGQNENEADYTYSDPENIPNIHSIQRAGVGGRSSAIRIKSKDHVDTKSTMGQDNSSYLDFDLPSQDPHYSVPRGTAGHFSVRPGGNVSSDQFIQLGPAIEESEDYSYAYTQDVVSSQGRDLGEGHEDTVSRRHVPVAQRSVSIEDEYSQPPDRLSRSSNSRTTSLDYTEPYQKGLVRNPLSPVISNDPGGIYELAKNVPDQPTQECTYNHLADTSAALQGLELNNPPSETESYDHLHSWNARARSSASPNSAASNYDSALSSPVKKNAHIPDDLFASGTSAADMAPSVYTDIPANYEEPWDSEEGQTKFNRLMSRAEKRHEKRASIDNATNPVTGAMATKAPAESVKSPVSDSDRKPARVSPVSKPTKTAHSEECYEVAWGGVAINQRNKNSFSASTKPSPKPVAPVPKPPVHIPSNYEEAWDLPEQQKVFEEKLQNARKQRASQGQIREPEHEEIFSSMEEISRQVAERRTTPRQNSTTPTSPTRRTEVELPPRTTSLKTLGAMAEKVDKTIPLQEQNFYHGMIKRSEAEKLLCVFKEGSYLVRRSETSRNAYSLTLKGWNSLPIHMKISCHPNGHYILGENSPPFQTIPEMVEYYTAHELPVQNADRICLLYPIPS